MLRTKSILYYSLLSALISMPGDSYSAMKINNKSRSYSEAYNQVNEMRASVAAPTVASVHTDDLGVVGKTENSSLAVDLPIRVANKTLASQIVRGEGTTVTVAQLEKCGAVYPDGEFAWDNPNVGARSGTGSQCVAVVEMRGYQMGANGSNLVLARVNVASGDSVKCNISVWPEYSYLPAAGTIEFPNDTEPTVEDVIAIMNQEQKQNAGIKIAAGTVLAAVAGNALGAKDVGKDSLFGTNKEKLTSTAIGGLTGAAIMAGNVYGGTVAGDMILSAGINAAAGGLIGNMAASGDSVLKIENCSYKSDSDAVTGASGKVKVEKQENTENSTDEKIAKNSDEGTQKCLWGMLIKEAKWDGNHTGSVDQGTTTTYFFDIKDEEVYKCTLNVTGGVANYQDCSIFNKEIANIIPVGYVGVKDANGEAYDIDKISKEGYSKIETSYIFNSKAKKMESATGIPSATADNRFIVIEKGQIVDDTLPVLLVGVKDKAFGWKNKDWETEFLKDQPSDIVIMRRGSDGQPAALSDDEKQYVDIKKFQPMYQDAEDGALVDFGNKARLKGTLIGAGAGGALGAFTAYQGAQSEIQERWVSAVREYRDSLQKVYCTTGDRFLTHYNDTVIIPNTIE